MTETGHFQRIAELIDAKADDVVAYLQSLLRIRSVNPVFTTGASVEKHK